MDIAIINSLFLVFKNNRFKIIKNAWLGIEGDSISYIGSMKDSGYKNANLIIDCKNTHVTMPGLINSHLHSSLTILRGTVFDVPEIEYMEKNIGFYINYLKPKDFILSSKLAVIEGLRSGTTTFVEYGVGVENLINKVYLPFKVRVVATELINEIGINIRTNENGLYKFHKRTGLTSLKRANRLFDKYNGNSLIKVMFGPQALDMISIELLKEIKNTAIEKETKFHMHVAQGEREKIQIRKRFGKNKTTVQILKKNGILCPELVAAHLHDTTDAEREIMVKKRVAMVGCPSSILKIDGIIPPIGDYWKLGGQVAIGTDEATGTGHNNMFNELRMASLLSKAKFKDPTFLPPWEILKMGTCNAAKIFELGDKVGNLEVGKKADIITIDFNKANLLPIIEEPFSNLLANLIYSNWGCSIDNVIINGKPVILNRKFYEINENKILNDVKNRAIQLFEEISQDWKYSKSSMIQYKNKGWI